jgi:recombination endonuclease VII
MPKGIRGRAACSLCDRPSHAKGLCANHYARQRHQTLQERKRVSRRRPCVICGELFDGIRGAQTCSPACYIQVPQNRERRLLALRRFYANQDPEVRRRRRNLGKYRISASEYDDLLANQGGRCAICGNPPSGQGTSMARLHIDHDHDTGRIRGLLCGRCNPGLGYFLDSPARLRVAADYIEHYRREHA